MHILAHKIDRKFFAKSGWKRIQTAHDLPYRFFKIMWRANKRLLQSAKILPVNLKVEEPIRDQLLNNNQSRTAIFALDSKF